MHNNHKVALLFPGQGSQFIGMGRDLHNTYQEARDVFLLLDEVLSQYLSKTIFEGDIAELTVTRNAQPAIMAVSMAVVSVLQKQAGINFKPLGIQQQLSSTGIELFCVAAGHSVGEYSALTAASSLKLDDTIKLLRARGDAMQNAVAHDVGGMAALLGAEFDAAAKLVAEVLLHYRDVNIDGDRIVCQIANDNGAGQIVLSGHMVAMDYAVDIARDFGIKKTVKLSVSGPFHSSLMIPAAKTMASALQQVEISIPRIPVIANYDCSLYGTASAVRALLTNQITGMVRWRETMNLLVEQYAVDTFLEIGPQRVLSNLAKRIVPKANVISVHAPEDIDSLLAFLEKG